VASQLGFITHYLARNPAQRRELIEQPHMRARATEEFLRRFSLPNTARVLTKDYVYKGSSSAKAT